MSDWQPGKLLEPVTPENPCGESLEDTALLASFDVFRLFGRAAPWDATKDSKEPQDQPPAWSDIREHSLEALRRSKDLRILAHLGAALVRTDGFLAFTQSLAVAAFWLDQWWEQTYPRVDEDAILRRSALNCFADPVAVVDGLRRAPLVNSRQHGTITLRALDIAAGVLQPGQKDVRFDDAQVAAAFGEMPLPALTDLAEALKSALASLKTMSERMASSGGAEAIPAFEPLAASLAKADRVVGAQLAARIGTASPDVAAKPVGEAGGVTVRAVGAIVSRGDAVAALDAVAEFFRRNEPASPVPLFLERAKRLVGKDFLQVLEDIAPDGLAQARSAGGLPRVE